MAKSIFLKAFVLNVSLSLSLCAADECDKKHVDEQVSEGQTSGNRRRTRSKGAIDRPADDSAVKIKLSDIEDCRVLRDALLANDMKSVITILERRKDMATLVDDFRTPMVFYAIKCERSSPLERMLQVLSADVAKVAVEKANPYGELPAQIAFDERKFHILALLLAKGASANFTIDDQSAVDYALENDLFEYAALLVAYKASFTAHEENAYGIGGGAIADPDYDAQRKKLQKIKELASSDATKQEAIGIAFRIEREKTASKNSTEKAKRSPELTRHAKTI